MTPVIITAEVAGGLIILAVIGVTAAAHEWIGLSCSLSLRFVPRSKRAPRTTVEVRHVLPGTENTSAPSTPDLKPVKTGSGS